jgi:hypothetical protein
MVFAGKDNSPELNFRGSYVFNASTLGESPKQRPDLLVRISKPFACGSTVGGHGSAVPLQPERVPEGHPWSLLDAENRRRVGSSTPD